MIRKSGKKRSFFEWIMRFLNVLFLFALITSYAAGSVSPERFWPLAFAAMAYPVILGTTICFMLYWLLKRNWLLLLNLAIILFRWDYVDATIQLPNHAPNEETGGIKVMSFNVRMFDHFNWSGKDDTRYNLQEFIYKQQPEILCIQEFYREYEHPFNAVDTLLRSKSLQYMHEENYPIKENRRDLWGVVTMTKYPILSRGAVKLTNSRSALCIYTDVGIEEDTVRIYNLHAQSSMLGKEGNAVLDEVIETQNLKDINRVEFILRGMKAGFIKRAKQADEVAEHIASCPYPIILCGDFNDIPTSYAYQRISNELKDSFAESGKGFGATYVKVPFFRIDNILFSGDFSSSDHTIYDAEAYSDHYAVSTKLTFNDSSF